MNLLAVLAAVAMQVPSPPLPPPSPPPIPEPERSLLIAREAPMAHLLILRAGSQLALERMLAQAGEIEIQDDGQKTNLADYYRREFVNGPRFLGWFKCENASSAAEVSLVRCNALTGLEGQTISRDLIRSNPTHVLEYRVQQGRVVGVTELAGPSIEVKG